MLLDLKVEALSANDRGAHWSARSRRTQLLVDKGFVLARAARVPALGQAVLTVAVSWPNRQRRDVSNLQPSFKALVDGMVKAGVLVDDDDTHLWGPFPFVTGVLSGVPKAARVVFEWRPAHRL